jgi:hypothetical protein
MRWAVTRYVYQLVYLIAFTLCGLHIRKRFNDDRYCIHGAMHLRGLILRVMINFGRDNVRSDDQTGTMSFYTSRVFTVWVVPPCFKPRVSHTSQNCGMEA